MSPSLRQFLYIPTLIMLGLIFWLSTISQPVFHANYTGFLDLLPLPEVAHRFLHGHYKLGHPLCYAIFTATVVLTLRGRYLFAVLVAFALGVAMEGVQHFLSTRSGDIVDLGYNLVGIIIGAGTIFLLKTMGRRMRHNERETPEKRFG